jgi:hypothetical protein
MLVHKMPVDAGAQLTLDSMSKDEALQLVRNMLCAAVAQMPDGKAYITGSEMVKAQLSSFKLSIQPSQDGQYIDFIRIETREGTESCDG